MLKKIILCTVALLVAAIAYWLIAPLFITKTVSEKMEDIVPPSTLFTVSKQGAFSGLAGHSAQGTAQLIQTNGKNYIRLEDDFRVTNGPDLFVYFGNNGSYVAEANLGALKGNVGGQNYEVPPTIDPTAYNEVWVWCRAFSVPFGKATLK